MFRIEAEAELKHRGFILAFVPRYIVVLHITPSFKAKSPQVQLSISVLVPNQKFRSYLEKSFVEQLNSARAHSLLSLNCPPPSCQNINAEKQALPTS